MTKKDLLDEYQAKLASGANLEEIVLSIRMPGGEIETISNPNVAAKIEYIDKTYDDDLVHQSNDQIVIEEVILIDDDMTSMDHNLPFNIALTDLKLGNAMARAGWNSSDQYVYYIERGMREAVNRHEELIANEDNNIEYGGRFAIKTVSGTVNTWVPSVSDILADDWYIVRLKKED